MIPVNDWSQFPEAIRRKLVMELAGQPGARSLDDDGRPAIILAQASPGYDCMIGEKMWRDRSFMWDAR
jgi:hypothetical protein